jgi:hypothetical protein
MLEGGVLAPLLGPILGVGESRGYATMYLLIGAVCAAASIVSWILPHFRTLTDLPDAVEAEETDQ